MNPSGVITKPEPFPLISRAPRGTLKRCLMSMLTTAGATRATALTTVREYSSSRAESSCAPKAFCALASSHGCCASPVETPRCGVRSAQRAEPTPRFNRKSGDAAFSFGRDVIVIMLNFKSGKPAVNYTCLLPIQAFLNVSIRLPLKGSCFTQKHAENCFHGFSDGCAMPVPACARPDCGQMDRAHHSDFGEGNDALRHPPARDRWNLAEDADANVAQSGTRRSREAHGPSGRASKSGIFTHEIGSDFD